MLSFLAVAIKVGPNLCGVLNVGLGAEVNDNKHWWALQLRLLAAVLGQYFKDADLVGKLCLLQRLHEQESIQQLSLSTLKGLYSIFSSLHDLQFFLALMLPGRPCAIMFGLGSSANKQNLQGAASGLFEQVEMHGFATPETLLEAAVESRQVMAVPRCAQYWHALSNKSPSGSRGVSNDVALLTTGQKGVSVQVPASMLVLPLVAPDGAKMGALYVLCHTTTDFGMVHREVQDLLKLIVPTLQQKLYRELSAKLIEVSESCMKGAQPIEDSVFEGQLDMQSHRGVVGCKGGDKDALIGGLQEQIRKQLAKLYKGQGDGTTHMLDGLELYEELGRGGYGTVYRASWRGQVAAVKIVVDRAGGTVNGALELALLTSISHPNIIQIHTYFADILSNQIRFVRQGPHLGAPNVAVQMKGVAGEQVCQVLVMDYCDTGSLADVLHTTPLRINPAKANLLAVLHCLLEVASAVQYLHSIGIVHYDLKPENVLLKSSTIDSRGFTCKVADFGLSSIVSDNSYFCKHAKGTITHLAPEALQSTGKLTKAVDVYAFGIIMWELFMGMRPYMGMRTIDVAVKVSKDGLRPEFPSNCLDSYQQLAQACWQDERRLRPTFSVICSKLQEILREVMHGGIDKQSPWTPVVTDYFAAHESQPIDCDFPLHIL